MTWRTDEATIARTIMTEGTVDWSSQTLGVASQVTISGATAFDNVFMLNGVDMDDNLFGSPNNLFIEDAIQETNVLTGGISTELGRFSGGVVNIITKSGGNIFSGSFRENFSNPKWLKKTPREDANNIVHSDILSKMSEGTVGGPMVKDRLWFFTAGRYEELDTPLTFVQTGGSAHAQRHQQARRAEVYRHARTWPHGVR